MVVVAARLTMAWRLHVLTLWQGLRLGLLRLLEVDLATSFYRLFLPGGTLATMAVRFHKLHQAERNWSAVLSSVLSERVLATIGAGVIGAVCFFADRPPLPMTLGALLLGTVVGGSAFAAALLHPASARLVGALAERVPVSGLADRVRRATDAMATYRDLPAGRIALLSALAVART